MKTTKVAETSLPTAFGTFRIFGFESEDKTDSLLALVMGTPTTCAEDDAPLVRIHSQCLTGDVFGSGRCDCGDQLHFALKTIGERGSGILIYQLQEGRGIGLMTSCRRTSFRTPATTRSRRITISASRPTIGTIGSALRCCANSECPACA